MYEILEQLREDIYLEMEEHMLPEPLRREAARGHKDVARDMEEEGWTDTATWHIMNMEGQRFLATTQTDETQVAIKKKEVNVEIFDGLDLDHFHVLLDHVCASFWTVSMQRS